MVVKLFLVLTVLLHHTSSQSLQPLLPKALTLWALQLHPVLFMAPRLLSHLRATQLELRVFLGSLVSHQQPPLPLALQLLLFQNSALLDKPLGQLERKDLP